ncbi:MAG: hypothetical protein AB7P17_11865 [Nitrospirales bacterium]
MTIVSQISWLDFLRFSVSRFLARYGAFQMYPPNPEVRSEMFNYIEVCYKRQLRHSVLGYRTVVEDEKLANLA